jgi:hypothetical protein
MQLKPHLDNFLRGSSLSSRHQNCPISQVYFDPAEGGTTPYCIQISWLLTWKLFHGSCAHISGFPHKLLPLISVHLYVSIAVARQRLDLNVTMTTNTHGNRRNIERVFSCSFHIEDSRRRFRPTV